MSRWDLPANEAAAALSVVHGVWLVDLVFDSGHFRANDGGADIVVGGDTYYAVGSFGGHDGIEESVEFVARGVRLTLTGVDIALISTVANESVQNRPAALYVAMLSEQGQLIGTPQLFWSGFMDTFDIEVAGAEAKLTIGCEHRLRNAPQYSRFADADQQGRSPGDRGFNMLHFVEGYTNTWGGKQTIYNYHGGGYPG